MVRTFRGWLPWMGLAVAVFGGGCSQSESAADAGGPDDAAPADAMGDRAVVDTSSDAVTSDAVTDGAGGATTDGGDRLADANDATTDGGDRLADANDATTSADTAISDAGDGAVELRDAPADVGDALRSDARDSQTTDVLWIDVASLDGDVACNDLPDHPPVTPSCRGDECLVGSGGTIVPGTYYLTQYNYCGCDADAWRPSSAMAGTWVVEATERPNHFVVRALEGNTGGAASWFWRDRWTAELEVANNALHWNVTCANVHAPLALGTSYYADEKTINLGNVVYTRE